MTDDPELVIARGKNVANPRIKEFLDELWVVFAKYELMLDRESYTTPLLIRDFEDDEDQGWLYGATDTTAEDFQGT